MRSFEALIKDINKNRLAANADISDSDPRTYTTKLGKKKRAKQNLDDLYLEYREQVKNRAVFILTKGAQSESFIDVATGEDFGCFEVEADILYNQILLKVDKRYYDDQTSSPALFDLLMSSFNDICNDIGIISYPAVLFEKKYSRRLKNKEDLLQLTKEAFNDKVGSDLVGLYAIDKVARKAVNEGYEGTTIPIIIHSSDKKLIDELEKSLTNINKNVFKVSASKKFTAEGVGKQLVKIKNSLK